MDHMNLKQKDINVLGISDIFLKSDVSSSHRFI
jgi:hypothetical protein